MRKSSWGVGAALAVSVLCAAWAQAAAAHVPYLPGDVTADECLRGGGLIVISADGEEPGSFTQVCRGGVHDGQTVTRT
ncbi:hypothetical protein [Streptomyces sp. enrichment culture]|uniref:hypothetical protein n=1 Tax=Streptomyces sp. enrichment culture TaxID=1795815 RepID=UPI003F571A5A